VVDTGEFGVSGAQLWLPVVYGIGTYHWKKSATVLYGLAFSTAFGIFLPVPILGLTGEISDSMSYFFILPILAQLNYRLDRQWSLSAALKGSGYETKVANDGAFTGRDPNLTLQERGFEADISASDLVLDWMSLQVQAGSSLLRSLRFTDSAGDIETQKIGSVPFLFQLSVTFLLKPELH
jgi:hypothetical protein